MLPAAPARCISPVRHIATGAAFFDAPAARISVGRHTPGRTLGARVFSFLAKSMTTSCPTVSPAASESSDASCRNPLTSERCARFLRHLVETAAIEGVDAMALDDAADVLDRLAEREAVAAGLAAVSVSGMCA